MPRTPSWLNRVNQCQSVAKNLCVLGVLCGSSLYVFLCLFAAHIFFVPWCLCGPQKIQSFAHAPAKNSNIFEYFQTFSNIFKRFASFFEYFRIFSNVFERFYLACLAQSLHLNAPTPIFTPKTHITP